MQSPSFFNAQTVVETLRASQSVVISSTWSTLFQEAVEILLDQALATDQRILYISNTERLTRQHTCWQTRYRTAFYPTTVDTQPSCLQMPPENAQLYLISPARLHHLLFPPSSTAWEHHWLQRISLIIVDGFDETETSIGQAWIELTLAMLCVKPGDGIKRQALITLDPYFNLPDVATWLNAALLADPIADFDNVPCIIHGGGDEIDLIPFYSALADKQIAQLVLTSFIAWRQSATFMECYAALEMGSLATELGLNFHANEVLADLHRHHTLKLEMTPDSQIHYRLTDLGQIMASHQLTTNDVLYLDRCLRIPELSWLDLLLMAATAPDFAPDLISYTPETTLFAQDMHGLPSSLLHSAETLIRQLQSDPRWILRGLFATHIGYYLISGMDLHEIAERLGIDVSIVELLHSSFLHQLKAMAALASHPQNLAHPLPRQLGCLIRMFDSVLPHAARLSNRKPTALGDMMSEPACHDIPNASEAGISDIVPLLRKLHHTLSY
jgi:hypothetical protein